MKIANTLIVLLFLAPTLVLFPLCVALQQLLCKKEAKWLGFLIPTVHVLTFLPVMLIVLSMVAFSSFTDVGENRVDSVSVFNETTGNFEEENTSTYVISEYETNWKGIFSALCFVIVYHVPTVVYIMVYRKAQKLKLSDEFKGSLEKMALQDLE